MIFKFEQNLTLTLEEEAAKKALELSQVARSAAKMSKRRSKRSSIPTKSYKENDSDDENEKFKSILGYESGSDYEDEVKKQKLADEEVESESDPEEDKLIIDEDLGDANDGYEIMTFLPLFCS